MFTIIYIAQESTMALCHLTSMIRILVLKYTCNHLVATHHSMEKEMVAYQSGILPLQQNSVQSRNTHQGSFSTWHCCLQSMFSRELEPKLWKRRGPMEGSWCGVVEVHFDPGFQVRAKP